MSVEAKIKQLLENNGSEQLTEESAEPLNSKEDMGSTGQKAASSVKKDVSKSAKTATAGDASMPKQGSSKEASYAEMDETDIGSKAASSVSKDTTLPKSKGDAKSVKTAAMEETEVDEVIHEDISSQLNAIFGEELSEEFKSKASSIFEAAVIARVNNEMDKINAKLEEQAELQLVEYKETLVTHLDNYLSHIVEQWMSDNQLAVDTGLRTEIAEEFIYGLKNLFKESFIEVPEEKYNVLEHLEMEAVELSDQLNEAVEANSLLVDEIVNLKCEKILEELTKDLATTDSERLKKLVEGIEFENEELFREKVSVIKENYFPKVAKSSPEQALVEESGHAPAFSDDVMSKYVSALSRAIKTR